ncbi:DUF4371 domain-containing protein [Trichonephila clavipes]|nr:DUF4371 domain-containing protein [Trichonephila clavipes]
MLDFESELLFDFLYRVVNDINYASIILLNCDIDLDEASRALAETKGNDFESFKFKASETTRKHGADSHFQEKRQRNVKKHFAELASDHRIFK